MAKRLTMKKMKHIIATHCPGLSCVAFKEYLNIPEHIPIHCRIDSECYSRECMQALNRRAKELEKERKN